MKVVDHMKALVCELNLTYSESGGTAVTKQKLIALTEQEQVVAYRLLALVREAAPDEPRVALQSAAACGALRAATALGLTPKECSADVLRALLAVGSEFDGGAGGWAKRVREAVLICLAVVGVEAEVIRSELGAIRFMDSKKADDAA